MSPGIEVVCWAELCPAMLRVNGEKKPHEGHGFGRLRALQAAEKRWLLKGTGFSPYVSD